MPSNQLPEDVREQMIRVISQAGTLHGTGTTTHMEVSALPEVFADAVLDAIAPLIIEWARKDQAEVDAQIVEGEVVRISYSATRDRAAVIRAQFAGETGGE